MLPAINLAKYYAKNLLSYKDDGSLDVLKSVQDIQGISPSVPLVSQYLEQGLEYANATGLNENYLTSVLLNYINATSLDNYDAMAKNQLLTTLSLYEPKALELINFKNLPSAQAHDQDDVDVYVHSQLAAILPQFGEGALSKPLLEYSKAVANDARLKHDFESVIKFIKDGGLKTIYNYIDENTDLHQETAIGTLYKCIQDNAKAMILAKDGYLKSLTLITSPDLSKEAQKYLVDEINNDQAKVEDLNNTVLKDFYTLRLNLDMDTKVNDIMNIKEGLIDTIESLQADIKEGKLAFGDDYNELLAGISSKNSLYINTENGSLSFKLSSQDLAKIDNLVIHNVAGLRFISDNKGNIINPNSIKGYVFDNAILQSDKPLEYLPLKVEDNKEFNENNKDINAKDFSFADKILTSLNGDKYYYQSETGKTLKYNALNKLYLEYNKDGSLNAVFTQNKPEVGLKVYNDNIDYNNAVISDEMNFDDGLPEIYVETVFGKEKLDFTPPAAGEIWQSDGFNPDYHFVAPEVAPEVTPDSTPEVVPPVKPAPVPPAEEHHQSSLPPMHEDAGPGPRPGVKPENAPEKPQDKPEEDKGNQTLPPVTPPSDHQNTTPPMFEDAGPGPAPEVTPAPPAEEKPEVAPEDEKPSDTPDEDVDANMQVDESTKNGFYLQVSPDGKYATYGSDYVYLAGKGVDLNKAELFVNDGVLQANITLKGIYSMAKDGQTQSYVDYAQGYSLSAVNGVLSGFATGDVLDLRPLQGKASITMLSVDGLTIKGGAAHENIVLDTLKKGLSTTNISSLRFDDDLKVDAKDFQNIHADKISVASLEVKGMISAANLRALDSDMVSFSGLHGGENFQPYHNNGVLNLSYDSMPYSLKLSSGKGVDHVSLGEVQSSHHGLDTARINVSGLKDVGDSISFKMQGDLVLGEQADISHTYATLGTDGILRPVDNGMSVSIYAIAAIVDRNAQSDNAVYLVQTAGRRGGDDYHILNIGEKEELSGSANDIWLMGVNKGVNLGLAVDGDTISVSVVS